MTKGKGRIGSSFEEYLREEGIYEDITAMAVKRVLAWQLGEAMAAQAMSKNRMARLMNTSRSQLDRVLDPENDSVQLDTLIKAARALGLGLKIELV